MNNTKLIEDIVQEVISRLGKSRSYLNHSSLPLLYVNQADSETIQTLENFWNVTEDPNESVDHALFYETSQSLLVKGAIGLADDQDSKILAKFLLGGKTVWMIPVKEMDWLLLSNINHTPYKGNLLAHKKKLEEFGVEFTSLNKFTMPNKDLEISSFTKLLTEEIVKDSSEKNIFIGRTTIVTPLARDIAKELGKVITLIE